MFKARDGTEIRVIRKGEVAKMFVSEMLNREYSANIALKELEIAKQMILDEPIKKSCNK